MAKEKSDSTSVILLSKVAYNNIRDGGVDNHFREKYLMRTKFFLFGIVCTRSFMVYLLVSDGLINLTFKHVLEITLVVN